MHGFVIVVFFSFLFFSFLFFSFTFSSFSFSSFFVTMGSQKNKTKKISGLRRRRLGAENRGKVGKKTSMLTLSLTRGPLVSPKQDERVRLYAVYEDRQRIAPLRGSSARGISKDLAHLARSAALNLCIVRHATGISYETMAESNQIRQVTKSVIEMKAAAKKKIEELKTLYQDRENRRREINTNLLREAIKRATFDHGLSLGASTQVRMSSMEKSHVAQILFFLVEIWHGL